MVLADARHWIEATTDQVIEIYRSTATMVPSGFVAPCQAFVCVLRDDEGERSCLTALFLKKSRKSVIFTEADGKLDAALDYADRLGFTMEKVNLDYKASLREVVLRDIPVLLSPQAASALRCKAAEAEITEAADSPAGKRQVAQQAAEAEAELEWKEALAVARQLLAKEQTLRRQQAEAAAAQAAREEAERTAVAKAEEIERIAAQQAAQAAEEARLLAEQKRREEEAEKERKAAERAALARAKAEAAEQERLAQERAAAAKAAAKEEARRRALAEETARTAQQEEAERMRRAAERLAAKAALEAERQRLADERQKAESTLRESERLQQQAKKVEALCLATEQRAMEVAEARRLASEQAQLAEAAVAELAAAQARAMQEAQEEARNLQQLATQQQELWLVAAQDAKVVAEEAKQLLEQADAARQAALAAMVTAEAAELALQKMEAAEQAVQKIEAAARELQEAEDLQEAEILELQHEISPAPEPPPAAALPVPSPADESRPVVIPVVAKTPAAVKSQTVKPAAPETLKPAVPAAVAPAVSVTAVPPVPSPNPDKLRRQAARSAAEERTRAQRLTAEQGEAILEATWRARNAREQAATEKRRQNAGQSARVEAAASDDPFAVLDSGAGEEEIATRFHLDERLTGIEYGTVEDIVEFHQSLNTVRLTPDQHPIQGGWAAVAAIRQGGTIQVFVALLLVDSCEALIYVPRQQPQRADDYGPVMQEALTFVEVVGFMMDCESFQTGGDNYALVLRKRASA